MFRNHLKIACRNLRASKGFSLLNISGLAVGMAGAILIFLWVQNELTYDDFHAHKNELYKVYNRSSYKGEVNVWDITSAPVAATLVADYPEVAAAARVYWPNTLLFSTEGLSLKATGHDVDKAFLSMFSFPLIKGNAAHALDDQNSIVITRTLAKKMFGDRDPLGRTIRIDNKDVYQVSGVLQDLPNNTQFDFEYLRSLARNEKYYTDGSWGNFSYITYVQLKSGVAIGQVNQKIKNTVLKRAPKTEVELFLHPLAKWRLYSRFENGQVAGGRIEIVRLLLVIAGLILLVASINFMNLSTARSQKRAKEVGVRKVMGAGRGMLIRQFLTESVLIAFVAGCFALVLVAAFLPAMNQVTQKHLALHLNEPYLLLTLLGAVLFTGILAGSYPAFFLSAFQPVKTLKGSFKGTARAFTPRKILVVTQFAVAIVLTVATIVVYRQINFAQDRDAGYQREHLIQLAIEGDIRKNFDLIRQELISTGAAEAACKTSLNVTIDGANSGGFKWIGSNPEPERVSFSRFSTTGDFVRTMGMSLVAGRDLDLAHYPADSAACLLNETAIRTMGIKDPVGQLITDNGGRQLRIAGVFKDLILNSPYADVRPMIVFGWKTWTYNMVIRLNPSLPATQSLALAAKVFKKYNPAYPFDYKFVDQEYAQKFSDQQQTGTLAAAFAGLTIFISCLGLFGLAAYMAENRAKEIGIRKVLGAGLFSVVRLLTAEFLSLVLIALVIAAPIGWWAMNKWLEDFTYRISLNWTVFALAGGLALLIALLTVSYQALKAALNDPIKSIRSGE